MVRFPYIGRSIIDFGIIRFHLMGVQNTNKEQTFQIRDIEMNFFLYAIRRIDKLIITYRLMIPTVFLVPETCVTDFKCSTLRPLLCTKQIFASVVKKKKKRANTTNRQLYSSTHRGARFVHIFDFYRASDCLRLIQLHCEQRCTFDRDTVVTIVHRYASTVH